MSCNCEWCSIVQTDAICCFLVDSLEQQPRKPMFSWMRHNHLLPEFLGLELIWCARSIAHTLIIMNNTARQVGRVCLAQDHQSAGDIISVRPVGHGMGYNHGPCGNKSWLLGRIRKTGEKVVSITMAINFINAACIVFICLFVFIVEVGTRTWENNYSYDNSYNKNWIFYVTVN